MASGNKELVVNTRERAVSVDINRLQKFRNADSAEFNRYLMDVLAATDDLDAGAITTEFSTLETPLRAEVINGLLVRPAVGTLNLTIDPGMVWMLSPDSAADDSNYKFIRDPGLGSGTLSFTAGGASARIDILECQPQSTTVETDTRDIFNLSTNTFAPTSVPKAQASTLSYRIRTGTPGSGFPGLASGWFPLLVVLVPALATSNDSMTFWDVRRMINDRAFGLAHLQQSQPVVRKANAYMNAAAGIRLTGFLENEYNGHRIGGNMLRGSPGTDSAYVDLNDAANQEQGYSAPTNGYAWLYLLFPMGLPRWARYTDALSGSRIPRSPRGIPVLSRTGPQHATGKPNAAITIPTAWGFGSQTTTEGLCVAGVEYVASVLKDSVIADGFQWFGPLTPPVSVNGTSATISGATFTFTENTHFPANAKSVLVQIDLVVSMAAASNLVCYPSVSVTGPSGSSSAVRAGETKVIAATSSNLYTIQVTVEVPVPSRWPSTTPGTLVVVLATNITNYAGSNTLSGTPTATINGWRF